MKPAKLSTRPVGGYGDPRGRKRSKRKGNGEGSEYGLHQAVGILVLALGFSLLVIILL